MSNAADKSSTEDWELTFGISSSLEALTTGDLLKSGAERLVGMFRGAEKRAGSWSGLWDQDKLFV